MHVESEKIRQLCLDLVGVAQKAQPKLPSMDLTHMLLLLYKVRLVQYLVCTC